MKLSIIANKRSSTNIKLNSKCPSDFDELVKWNEERLKNKMIVKSHSD